MRIKSMIARVAVALLSLCLSTVGMYIYGNSIPVYGATGQVKVTVPTFKVTLNGTEINNQNSKYPLIVYKNITYFPMTYYDCRFLGLETDWQGNENGLFIKKSDVRGGYTPYTIKGKNAANGTAKIVNFPLHVNGKAIDNAKEAYPVLNFRDITYFPMTWQYCVDNFGWNYSFDNRTGLCVKSSDKAVISYGSLPGKDDDEYINVTSDGQYVYYPNKKGEILKLPLEKLTDGKPGVAGDCQVMFKLPKHLYLDGYASPYYFDFNGHRYIRCVTGGVMGTDYQIEVDSKGFKEITSDRIRYYDYGEGKVFAYGTWVPPAGNNLYWKKDANTEEKIGNPDYLYGWDYKQGSDTSGGKSTDCIYYDGGNYVYVLATDLAKKGITGIYQVDLRNNDTVRITAEGKHTGGFFEEAGKLYFNTEGTYYIYDTVKHDTKELGRPEKDFSEFVVLSGKLYGVTGYEIADVSTAVLNCMGEEGKLTRIDETYRYDTMSLKTDSVTGNKYLVVGCTDGPGIGYRLAVIDQQGKVVLKSGDKIIPSDATVKNGNIYYYNLNSGRLCKAAL